MTDKQKGLIIYLDSLCKERGLSIRATNEDMLGNGWWLVHKNITFEYTNEVINRLKTALGMEITKKKRGKK